MCRMCRSAIESSVDSDSDQLTESSTLPEHPKSSSSLPQLPNSRDFVKPCKHYRQAQFFNNTQYYDKWLRCNQCEDPLAHLQSAEQRTHQEKYTEPEQNSKKKRKGKPVKSATFPLGFDQFAFTATFTLDKSNTHCGEGKSDIAVSETRSEISRSENNDLSDQSDSSRSSGQSSCSSSQTSKAKLHSTKARRSASNESPERFARKMEANLTALRKKSHKKKNIDEFNEFYNLMEKMERDILSCDLERNPL